MNCSPESQAAVPPWLGLGFALNKRRPLVRYELPKEIEREGEMERQLEQLCEAVVVPAH